MSFMRRSVGVVALALTLVVRVGGAEAAATEYKFEAVGNPQPSTAGKSIVAVRLIHAPDNKPVLGAIIIQTRADMTPDSMPEMTAPVKTLPPTAPDTYRFEIEPGMSGGWMLTLAAKVQGEAATVRGTVTVKLTK